MSSVKKDNNREFSRSLVRIQSEVRLPSGILLEGQINDVSLNGASFASANALPIGNEVHVTLILGGGETTELRIKAEGEVARLVEGGVAIQFTSVDAEGLEHLRKLVLYNAEDADKTSKEFDEHMGLRPREL
jgi:hypothetical protein